MINRGVVYTGYDCNFFKGNDGCKFCYYKHDVHDIKPLREIKAVLNKLKFYYKLDYVDITGGEPLMHPDIIEILHHCKEIGVKPTVITNASLLPMKYDKIKDLVEDFLISIHGHIAELHDSLCGVPVFDKVINFIEATPNLKYRINTVMVDDNQPLLEEIGKFFVSLKAKPTEVNFILFNPFGKWGLHPKIDFMANPQYFSYPLLMGVKHLEKSDIRVNVRYLPYCFAKGFEKNIVGFSQVAYDNKEWNWYQQSDQPYQGSNWDKNIFYKMGRTSAVNNSAPLESCRKCKYEFICDGLGHRYHKDFGDITTSIEGEKILRPDEVMQ